MNFENFKIIRPGDAPAEPVQEEVIDSSQSEVVDTSGLIQSRKAKIKVQRLKR